MNRNDSGNKKINGRLFSLIFHMHNIKDSELDNMARLTTLKIFIFYKKFSMDF